MDTTAQTETTTPTQDGQTPTHCGQPMQRCSAEYQCLHCNVCGAEQPGRLVRVNYIGRWPFDWDAKDKLDTLRYQLRTFTLDPTFEKYGDFVGDLACIDEPGVTRFSGNFFDVSATFSVDTNVPALVAELIDLIKANKATAAYKAVEVGDRVFYLLPGLYVTVLKKNRQRLHVLDEAGREYKASVRACQWLHYNELKACAAEGKPVRPRPALTMTKEEG